MKIALIGYGVMGRLIEATAIAGGHSIGAVIDEESADLSADELALKISDADAAIDFSISGFVIKNIEACVIAGVPMVEGTTGWMNRLDDAKKIVKERDGSFVYGSNFSIGVNLFYRVVDHAASLFSRFEDYEIFIEEQHHSRKVDAPSGTALKLKSIVRRHFDSEFGVTSTRAGNIPGTHRVGFDGAADQILLEHNARSREGFAAGAVGAAEWITGKQGFWEFTEIIDSILGVRNENR